jgi:citrate synthase
VNGTGCVQQVLTLIKEVEIMSQIPESANKGLENIVACTTEVSSIQDTTLLYRGYTIEDLAAHAGFEEVIWLLWKGELPTEHELGGFRAELLKHTTLTHPMIEALTRISATSAHPMAKLRTAISHYGLLQSDSELTAPENMLEQAIRLTGAFGSIVATLSRLSRGLPLVEVKANTLAEHFLHACLGQKPSLEQTKLFDTALVLHADHELNASAFTARVVSSTQADYISAVVGAIASLKGPLHGGANEQVMLMLKQIGSLGNVAAFIEDAIQMKKKVMGIGHRVYKNGDPRARLLRELSRSVCQKAGLQDFHLMLSTIESEMESKKGLMPNVDFYSGLVYTALGLQPSDFTPIFAMSRVAGWSAQVFEQIKNNRIYRPRGYYTGPLGKEVRAKEKRIA